MAQLSDDCFAFGGPMMSVHDALALIAARVSAIKKSEPVSLTEADGRVLANDIVASVSLPPFTNSAVDGYAVRIDDVAPGKPRVFPVGGRVQAGATAAQEKIKPGHAVRIFTGAPMPLGADTVFMQEDVQLNDSGVLLPAGLKAGANVRLMGEDIPAGSIALPRGRRLRPQDVALIAALGLTEISVRLRLRVAVFSTGNELVTPGQEPGSSQQFDSNRYMLMAMLRRLGCTVGDLGILRDEHASLAQALKDAASDYDLIVTSGGVSTGEEDHVKSAIESVGSLVLWRMAIKPGRPVAMGLINGTPLIGLPGNPVASFVTFTYVVRPTVLALCGAQQEPIMPTPVRAAFAYKKKASRREYVRASIHRGGDGSSEAVKFPREGAGLLSSLVETDGLIELGEDVTEVKPGDVVNFLSYAMLL